MWRLPNDETKPVITAQEQLLSSQGVPLQLPETALVFFMSRGCEYLAERYSAQQLPNPLPRFLNRCPVWEIQERNLCFLDGGRGAPQAVDTVETLSALGIKNIIALGMCGGFDPRLSVGQVLAPPKAFVEEGTSLHYYQSIEAAQPDAGLLSLASTFPVNTYPIVSTDAVYRQTSAKEQRWREQGAVAVDMETSAVFSVAKYLGLRAVALLTVSDLHPLRPDAPKWAWRMTRELRYQLAELGISLAQRLQEE